MNFASFKHLLRAAASEAGPCAPALLARYAALTRLNRTSRNRPILRVPTTFEAEPASVEPPKGDILVPVYNNFVDTRALLAALAIETAFTGKIIIVHDASTDERLAPLVRRFANADARTVLIENPSNLGFVKSCNAGFRASQEDVLILNTDITLPAGAPGRLLRRLQSDRRTATVTPFSNCAYGVGLPHLVFPNSFPFGAPAHALDTALQTLAPLQSVALATGVGFCMAISREALDALDGFDEAFSPGYGEETDFCQRAAKLGFAHVLAPDVYVEHKGGVSFGGAWQDKSRRGLLKVLRRHPEYVARVNAYLKQGEARAVILPALMALAERHSGTGCIILEDNTASADQPPNQPVVKISWSGTGWRAKLTYASECFDFDFASRHAVYSALAIHNSSSVNSSSSRVVQDARPNISLF